MTASTGLSALVMALETMEEELAIRLIPQERSVMLLQVSKTMRTAMQRVSPPAMITVKPGQRPESVKNAMLNMMKWCRITAIDLSPPPSSSPPKTPTRSYSAQIRSQNEEKSRPPQTVHAPTDEN